jgi:hypothetical protein
MKTLKNIKDVKPLPKQKQKTVTGGNAAAEESFAEDTSKPRPPLIIIAG